MDPKSEHSGNSVAFTHDSVTQRRETKLRLALEAANAGTWSWDARTNEIEWDELSKKILGVMPGEPVSFETWAERIHPDDRDRMLGHVRTLQRGEIGGPEWSAEYRVIRPDGTVVYVQALGRVQFDATGRVVRLSGINLDITERQRIEAALHASEERLELAIKGTSDGIWEWIHTSGEVYLSERFQELLGFLPGELKLDYAAWKARVHPEDAERVVAALRLHLETAKPFDEEYRLRTNTGEYRWFRDRAATIRDKAGKPLRTAGSLTDIHERVFLKQRLEEALRYTDAELRAVIAASPLAIWTVDRAGKITSWTAAAERLFGYAAAEVIGRWNPSIRKNEMKESAKFLSAALNGPAASWEQRRRTKQGLLIDVRLYCARLPGDATGEGGGAVLLAEDITHEKQVEAELVRVRRALAAAQEDEARYIARELHDDVTQRLALLSVDMGIAASGWPEGSHWKAQLRACQQQLIDISESIRQISHRMHPSILDQVGLAEAIEFLCIDFAKSHHLPLQFHADPIPKGVSADVGSCLYRVTQVALRNIAMHAGAADASVHISVDGDAIHLAIIDSGCGFDPSKVKSGLGLHSMRERVRLVSGTIAIDSEPGVGTRIVVRCPLARAQAQAG